MTSPGPSTADLYRTAAMALQTTGWVQSVNSDSEGRHCLTAAINLAAGRHDDVNLVELYTPLLVWLVNNRTTEVKAAAVLQFGSDHAVVVSLFPDDPVDSPKTADDIDLDGYAVRIAVQLWNDFQSHSVGIAARYGFVVSARTADDVITALRAAAEWLDGESPAASVG